MAAILTKVAASGSISVACLEAPRARRRLQEVSPNAFPYASVLATINSGASLKLRKSVNMIEGH